MSDIVDFIDAQEYGAGKFDSATASSPALPKVDISKMLREDLADLLEPSPKIFWTDLILSSTIAWSSAVLSLYTTFLSLGNFLLLTVSILAIYRATMFVHELSHLEQGRLKYFACAWNMMVGFPLLFPSFTYVGMHRYHHNKYGTGEDPNYLPFFGNRMTIVQFLLTSLVYPLFSALRFLVIAPFGLAFPQLHSILERHASSYAYNMKFTRKFTKSQSNEAKLAELVLLAYWACLLSVLYFAGKLSNFAVLWYAIVAACALLNSVKALTEHKYQLVGYSEVSRTLQVSDSLNVTSGFLKLILSPSNVGYHATHHLFPSIPYHNLPLAHKRILGKVEPVHGYDSLTADGSLKALLNLWNGTV